jgi:ABC-type multidrug transport system fused ATPase/permease subunit/pSer/pThr/pTyr-binding forkhead associated (FHA) protein
MPALMVKNGSLAGRWVEVDGELIVGRQDADVTIDDERISRRHALIRAVAGGLAIEDLGSLNGTWVNGTRVEASTRLEPGDIVEVGRTLIEVEPSVPVLIVRNGALAGQRFEVGGELTVGRQNADLIIDDEQVSRRHAVVRQTPSGLSIEDLGSLNGTSVNERRIEGATPLSTGDTIEIGDVRIEVDAGTGRAGPTRERPIAGASPAWVATPGKGVVVHVPEGSYAASRVPTELREAERALAALEQLLRPADERKGAPIDVYVTDGFADLAADGSVPDRRDGGRTSVGATGERAVVRVVQPEAPGEPVTWPVTRLAIARWFGSGAASADLLVTGIAGVVAAGIGAGPTLQEVRDRIRDELAAGGSISIFTTDETAQQYAATSFVAYLLEAHGPEPMRQLLAEYDPERRDQAAIAAYERPLGALEEAWQGSFMQLAGSRRAFRQLFRYLMPLVKPYWLRWLEIALYMGYGVGFTLALPFSFKYLFDTVLPGGQVRTLVIFVVVLFGIFLLNALVGMRRAYASSWVNQRILLGLQQQMFNRLQRLSHRFYGRAKVGDLMSRLSQDLDTVNEAMTAVLTQGVFLIVQGVGAAIAAVYLSPLLGALVLVVVPLFAISYLLLLSRLQRASLAVQTRFGDVLTVTQENLSAHHVIKAFGLEQRSASAYRARLAALFRSLLRLVVLGSLFEASIGMATTLGQLLVLGVGGYLVIQGDLTLGTLVAFVGLMPSLFQPITQLATVGQTVQRATGAMERVLEVLNEPVEIEDRDGAAELAPLDREIRFERATFGYDPDRTILSELDLTIPAGSHTAIVGPSGSGKSTVVNLLLRFWDPDDGRILFDGRDIRDVSLSSLRGQIGLVFQDTFIFDTSLRENIAIGRAGANDEEVAEAARAAKLDSYVQSLPAGYDTVLGERGVRMSGGQRQRLAIARALLRDPSILVLDEATSALDAQTENEILETLVVLAKGRTTISITHRLSLAATADRILVLDQGRLVEEGAHDDLVRAGGLYQRLYEEQTGYATAHRLPRVEIEAARLKTIPLFGNLSGAELPRLAELLNLERFSPGEEVVTQGERGDKLYLVNRGQLEVVVSDERSERSVNTLHEGDYFGEMALLTDEPRSATVRATMPSDLYSLARSAFESLVEREPEIRSLVAATVAGRRSALATAALAAEG